MSQARIDELNAQMTDEKTVHEVARENGLDLVCWYNESGGLYRNDEGDVVFGWDEGIEIGFDDQVYDADGCLLYYGDYPTIRSWIDGYLETDIATLADKLLAEDPNRTPAYARAVAGAMLVMFWSPERERLEHAAMNSTLPADLESFYDQVCAAEETPSPRGGSGYVNDVIDLSGNRAIWNDVDTLRLGRMP
jgi:hypothetical protein